VAGSCEHGKEPSGNFLTNKAAIGFSRRTLLHGVSYLIRSECRPNSLGLFSVIFQHITTYPVMLRDHV
jgi:hypothetical protein